MYFYEVLFIFIFLKQCNKVHFHLIFYLLILEGKGEKETSICFPLIYTFIGCFLYVPWPGIEPASVVYSDNALTNWTT